MIQKVRGDLTIKKKIDFWVLYVYYTICYDNAKQKYKHL